MLTLLLLVVIAALVFDFINGFHDAANAIATSVATGVMSVRTAVIVSGVFNFLGACAGTAVAGFIASGLVTDASLVTTTVVLATLIGASAWNLITWWWGIPSSSSHALIGALAGAVVAFAGVDAFVWSKLVEKVLIPLVLSPVIGFALAFVMMVLVLWLCRRWRPHTVNGSARLLQLLSACTLSFAHGQNDAQKVMGVITLALAAFMAAAGLKPLLTPTAPNPLQHVSLVVADAGIDVGATGTTEAWNAKHAQDFKDRLATYGDELQAKGKAVPGPDRLDPAVYQAKVQASAMPNGIKANAETILPTATLDKGKKGIEERNQIPFWTIVACALAMCLGTIAGGKRIIKTMGSKLIRIQPVQGFAAQTSGTAVIMVMSALGNPISTTHCITASIMGAGTIRGMSAIRWRTAISIVIAWVFTLPASAAMAWLCMKGFSAAGW
jgi:phosphate/sulfate permease